MDQTTTEPKKKKVGRPSKLTYTFLEAASEVINAGDSAIIHTDADLLFLINEKLEEGNRISESCFEKWKAGEVDDDVNGKEFLRLIKKALIVQRDNLFERFKNDNKSWQKWAWIIERKFKDWRLPNKTMLSGDPDNPTPIAESLEVTFINRKSDDQS